MPIEINFADPPKEIGSCLVVEPPVRVALHMMFMKQYAPQQKYRVELQIPETASGKKARAPYCMGGKLILPLQIRHNERSQSFLVLAVIEPREGADVDKLATLLAPSFANELPLVTLQKP